MKSNHNRKYTAKSSRKRNAKQSWLSKLPKWLKVSAVVALLLVATGVIVASPYLTATSDKEAMLYLRRGTANDVVADSLASCTSPQFAAKVMKLVTLTRGDLSTRQGAFKIEEGESALSVAHHLRRGAADDIKLTLNNLRTKEDLAKRIAKKLMMTKDEMLAALNDKELCAAHGLNPDNITSVFLPDTYQFMWDVEPAKLLEHMCKYSDKFWNDERKEKAQKLGLTPVEVVTLRNACDYTDASDGVRTVQMLGYSMNAVAMPKDGTLTYRFDVEQDGEYIVQVALIPTQPADNGDIRFSMSIDGNTPIVYSLKEPFRSEEWKQNVLRGQALRQQTMGLFKGSHILTIHAFDNHIVVDQFQLMRR